MTRCTWCGDDPLYVAYHDNEWGRPVTDADALFQKICLEGFQSGLAWITILRKRENFRRAFNGFTIDAVASMSDAVHVGKASGKSGGKASGNNGGKTGSSDDIMSRLLGDAGIVRHRGKIEATLNNAQCARAMRDQGIDLAAHIWSFALDTPWGREPGQHGIPTTSPNAIALSKDLKKRGWRFVGPTTMYSFMQSMGLVNDHTQDCSSMTECEEARQSTLRSGLFSRAE